MDLQPGFDYSHNTPEDFPDPDYYRLFEKVTETYSDRVRVVSYTKIERAYALDKNTCWTGPFADAVIKPVGDQLSTTVSGLPQEVQDRKGEYLFIPPYLNDEKLIDYHFLKSNGILHYRGRYNGPDDLIGFKAILAHSLRGV